MERFVDELNGMPIAQVRGIVIPEKPVFDKILAVWTLLRLLDLERQFVLQTWAGSDQAGNVPSRREFDNWREQGLYLVDVGPNKYQRRGLGSATEVVLCDLGVVQAAGCVPVFQASSVWLKGDRRAKELAGKGAVVIEGGEVNALAELRRTCTRPDLLPYLELALMANRNNATGYLKGYKRSLVWLLRELYKEGEKTEAVLGLVLPVITAYFAAVTTEPKRPGEEICQNTTLDKLFDPQETEVFLGHGFEPFTMGRYLRDLWVTGTDVAEIERQADDWLVRWADTELADERCAASWAAGTCQAEVFGQGKGVIVRSDDPRLSRWVMKTQGAQVVVVMKSKGNVAILTDRKVNIASVAKELLRQEPKRWYFDERIGAVLNGGHSFGSVPPTEIPIREIRRLIGHLSLGTE